MRLLERREMRQSGYPQQPLQLGHVRNDGHDAAIVRAKELPQREQGEQLPLGEVSTRELRGIGGQTPTSSPQGHPGQRDRRTRHASLCFHQKKIGFVPRNP